MPLSRPSRERNASTAEALLDAAEALMLESGYAAVTSRRVAARAGTDAALVYYYFGTMDDLFIALFRRRSERSFALQMEALSSPQPLWSLWDSVNDQTGAALTDEFIALANHRRAIRTEIAKAQLRFRRMQLERLSGVLERYGVDSKQWPLTSIVLLLTGISRYLLVEQAFAVDVGHADTIALVERQIRALEGERADRHGRPRRDGHVRKNKSRSKKRRTR